MTLRPSIIGVIDLRDGLAVHATGGDRRCYEPITAVVGRPIAAGDARAVARYHTETCGVDAIYVADLDAIGGAAWQTAAVASIAAHTRTMYLDAGVTTPGAAERARALGATQVVVGLETLDAFASLGAISARLGEGATVFSLDLRDGRPLTRDDLRIDTIEDAVSAAVDAGVTAIIVLDLAQVGQGRGPALEAIARVRRAAPDIRLIAGGGVRDDQDLRRLGNLGCDAALVGTALLKGTLR